VGGVDHSDGSAWKMSFGEVFPIILSSTSILFAVTAFLHGWKTKTAHDGAAHSLVFLWKRASAAGGIPTAITLIICSVKPSLLAYTPGLGLPIALGGLSLLYICLEVLTGPESKPENKK
jgi:hypothetical protein